MRKIVRRQKDPRRILPRKPEQLGSIVEVAEISLYSSPKCKSCRGGGTYYTLKRQSDGSDVRVANACGCAREGFLAANIDEVGYDPNEAGVPVRWLIQHDPRREPEAPCKAG